MEPKYQYKTESHHRAPDEYDWDFKTKVAEGWRLVSLVKQSKDTFYSYWEKPYNDSTCGEV